MDERRRRRRPAILALVPVIALATAMSIAGAATSPPPAYAEEYVPPSRDGTFTIYGHGFGHGIGMSQYGALGAAKKGRNYTQILSFYYPGTVQHDVGDPQIRVHLTAYDTSSTITVGAPNDQPVTVTDLARNTVATGPATKYRVSIQPDSGLVVSYLDSASGKWIAFKALSGPMQGPITFSNGGSMRVYSADGSARQYRGVIRIARVSTGSSVIAAINDLDMQSYLYGVVPREMPDSWGRDALAALQAQAIAARSYALAVSSPSGLWDICDTSACQVYGGQALIDRTGAVTQLEGTFSQTAVNTTRGIALYDKDGDPAFTQFSASNGGQIAPGKKPYLIAQPDPYDTSAIDPNTNWRVTISVASLEAKYPSIGQVRAIDIISRDGFGDFGGRISSLRLVGTLGTVDRPSLGLKSSYWTIITPQDPIILGAGSAIGHLDSVVLAGPGKFTISGWSFNDLYQAAADYVDVYMDGVGLARLAANRPRPDVGAAFPNAGQYHGFQATFDAPGGRHLVCAYGIDGVRNPQIGCHSVTILFGNPRGSLDVAKGGFGWYTVGGWALDPDTAASVSIHIYDNGKFVEALVADGTRVDVAHAFPGYGADHGFSATIAPSKGTHNVCVYAINVGAGSSNPLIACRVVTVQADTPVGHLDVLQKSPGSIGVAGWALDPNTSSPVSVHVYVDGRFAAAVTASISRPDVARVFPGYGEAHGFATSVPTYGGQHRVCVYAINVGPGDTNPVLGCGSV